MLDAFSYINRSAESRNSFYKFMAMPSDDPPHGPYGPKAVVPAGGYYRRATSTVIPGAIALSSIAEPRDSLEPELPPEEHAYIARHHGWEAGSEEREAERAAQREGVRERELVRAREFHRQEAERWREAERRFEAMVVARNKFISTNLGLGKPF